MSTISNTTDARVRVLADGTQIPRLGLGVWQVPNGPTTVDAVRWALKLGYRHIDTAQVYGNETSVGRAPALSDVPREEIFVTTKFMPPGAILPPNWSVKVVEPGERRTLRGAGEYHPADIG